MDKKIYILEDEIDSQLLLTAGLTKRGFQVKLFNDGSQLLSMLKELPDIFILDVNLPGISGLEVCRWLKSHMSTVGIPVILASANPRLNILAVNARANDFLEKPFSVSALLAKISHWI
jgi:DNA-binding response OmpR family regulator